MAESTGQRVRAAYLAAGMNRRQFSVKTGLDYATIMKWEDGAEPDLKSLRRTAEATGKSVSYFLGEETTLDRDDEQGIAVVEAFLKELEKDERPAAPADARTLRALRGRLGGTTITPTALRGWYRGLVSDRLAAQVEGMPKAAPEVPEGRRRVGPAKKR